MKFDSCREEKALHHVAMVPKFLDDNKSIKPLKSLLPNDYNFKGQNNKTISKASLNSLNVLECKYDDFVVCIERPGMKF